MNYTKKVLVIDLEATCWQSAVPKNQKSEIIEIGLCLLDATSGETSDNIGILVKPIYSAVSEFCTALTTITPALLDRDGIYFEQACVKLEEDYNSNELTWASYGAYDLKMMKAQCASENIAYPLSLNHVNVKELFKQKMNLQKPIGMNGALKVLNLPLEGTHHRGVDDAKNIARILYWCLNN